MIRTIALGVMMICASDAVACTAFSLPGSEEKLVAKSFDWTAPHGMVLINARGVEKTSLAVGEGVPAQWTSRFGSVTFHQVGREFPYGGMNEKGLVVEILHLTPVARVAAVSSEIPEINELQWIQRILDTSSTLEEAKAAARSVRVVPMFGVHYFVCDAAAHCAVFEFDRARDDAWTVTDVGDHPVITNNTVARSLEFLAGFEGFGGARSLPGGPHPLARYARAAAHVQKFRPGTSSAQALAYAWQGLEAVKNSETMWQMVYSPGEGRVRYKAGGNQPAWTEQRVSIQGHAFDCIQPVMMSNMEGRVPNLWRSYAPEANSALVEKNLFLSRELRQAIAAYPQTGTRCWGQGLR